MEVFCPVLLAIKKTEKGCGLFSCFKNKQYEKPQLKSTFTSSEEQCDGSSD